MKLNHKKCTFGIEEGMFLGYKVNTKGIIVCPDKVEAVQNLPSPKCLKEELIVYLAGAKESPRISVNGQIFADFIVERSEDNSLSAPMEVEEELSDLWTLFTDGSSCIDGYGAGLILTDPEGTEYTYALRFRLDATNNEAEYEALIADLRIAKQIGVKNLQTHVDFRLVANQINGSCIAIEPWPRSMVAKAIRIGYYWPTMHKDARKVIQECQDFQVHCPVRSTRGDNIRQRFGGKSNQKPIRRDKGKIG
ncbi:reverse transcriptase domain-containing protein [Tanacetum coccineum]